jgi:hypothetical protein
MSGAARLAFQLTRSTHQGPRTKSALLPLTALGANHWAAEHDKPERSAWSAKCAGFGILRDRWYYRLVHSALSWMTRPRARLLVFNPQVRNPL